MKTTTFHPSKQQIQIQETYQFKNCNLCISAGAGTGKTTTLKMLSQLTPASNDTLFLAFNNAIVDELKEKLPPYIKCSTIHKIGLRALYNKFGGPKALKITQWKTYTVVQKFLTQWKIPIKKRTQYSMRLSHVWDFYRLHNCETIDDIKLVMKNQGSEITGQFISHFRRLRDYMYDYNTRESHGAESFMIDMVDMIYLPILINTNFPKYDEVFVDEAQDCNRLQQEIVKRLLKPKGRFIAVGDPKQAIYAFAGADAKSFQYFLQTPNTIELPLSITYRCPKVVVELANRVFPGLNANDKAIPGIFRTGDVVNEAMPGDFVLCRNTDPLLQLCFELIAQEKKVLLKGDDITKKLLQELKPYKNYTASNAIDCVSDKRKEMMNELKIEGVRNPNQHSTIVRLDNLKQALRQIQKRFSSVEKAYRIIQSLSKELKQENQKHITLTTMHGSKGLEANRVFIIRTKLIPSKFAITEAQKLQEKNLWYVAITRTKKELIIDNNF